MGKCACPWCHEDTEYDCFSFEGKATCYQHSICGVLDALKPKPLPKKEEKMFPGETLLSGAPRTCPSCKREVELEVCRSGAGYYVGSHCNCGPYTRESDYYPSYPEAEKDLSGFADALEKGHNPPKTARSTGFKPGTLTMRGLGEVQLEREDGSTVRMSRSSAKDKS